MSERLCVRWSVLRDVRAGALPVALLGCLCALCAGPLLSSAQAAIVHDYLSQISEIPATGPKGKRSLCPGR